LTRDVTHLEGTPFNEPAAQAADSAHDPRTDRRESPGESTS
jgi:hypothetical protein